MKADSVSFLIICPVHKANTLKELFYNHFPQAFIGVFAAIELKEIPNINIQLNNLDWVVLTSSFAAKIFVNWLSNIQSRAEKILFASVGPSVSKVLNEKGFEVKIESKTSNIDGLIESFDKVEVDGKNILFLTGNKTASGKLMEVLIAKGAKCQQQIIYKSNINSEVDLKSFEEFKTVWAAKRIICFTSPEAVSNFKKILENQTAILEPSWILACLGPATEERARELFKKNQIASATEYNYEGLISLCERLSTFG